MVSVKEYFGFTSSPFSKNVAFKDFFRYGQIEELFNVLNATVEDASMALVTGRAGAGKTTAVRVFLEGLPANRYRTIYLGQDKKSSALMCRLGVELGIRASLNSTKRMLLLSQRLQEESCGSGRQLIVVLDEAHLLEQQALEEIRLLTNLDMDKRSPITVIMLGQHWLRNMLRKQGHEALFQRLRLRYALEGLTQNETQEYVKYHLKLVGGNENIFEQKCYPMLFEASGGILREINNLAFECLLRAASLNRKTIGEKILNWVIDQREIY